MVVDVLANMGPHKQNFCISFYNFPIMVTMRLLLDHRNIGIPRNSPCNFSFVLKNKKFIPPNNPSYYSVPYKFMYISPLSKKKEKEISMARVYRPL